MSQSMSEIPKSTVFQLTNMKAKRLGQEMVSLQISLKDPILTQKEPQLTHTKEEMPKVMETKALIILRTQLKVDAGRLLLNNKLILSMK